MFKYSVTNIIVVVVLVFFGGCSKLGDKTKRITIAQVGEKILYLDNIAKVIPNKLPPNDSIMMAEDYIKKWIKKELLIQKAEENLSVEQKDVSQELEEYRNSLIIYKYKNELMRQRMDTVVSSTQIEDYYESNKDNFKLNKNIVKAIFIKIPSEFADPQQLKNYCSDTSQENLSELREFCVQYAKAYDIFMDNWVDFELVLKNIPQNIEDPASVVPEKNFIEITDSNYYYLVSVHDYRLKNELAPLEYIEKNIKNLILNKRKIDFLKEIEDNVYSEAVRRNKFKIHNLKTNETE